MFITLIRTSVLYIFVIAIMRMMGKRQIGELQPSDLVITLLISQIISIPIQDTDIPLVNTIIPMTKPEIKIFPNKLLSYKDDSGDLGFSFITLFSAFSNDKAKC